MSKNNLIKSHLSKYYKDKLIEKANARGMTTTEYLTRLIEQNLLRIPPHKLPYLINREHTVLGIRVDDELYQQLKNKVNFEGMTVSEWLRELIYTDIRNGNNNF